MKTLMIDCSDWYDCGMKIAGCCRRGWYGGKPSRGVCLLVCQHGKVPPSPPVLIGDRVASWLKRLSIDRFVELLWNDLRACDVWSLEPATRSCGCNARRQWLNRWSLRARRKRKPRG